MVAAGRRKASRGARRLLLLGLVLGCADAPQRSPEAFCARLRALGEGSVDVGHEDRNELVGHVASLDALIDVAPGAARADLELVRDRLAAARDAGGWRTLLDFAGLQKTDLVAAEGRVTEFVAEACGIRYGDVGWTVDEPPAGEPACPAWPRVGSPLRNNRFPYLIATAAANYFATTFWSAPLVPAPPGFIDVPRGGRVVFRGEYPFARYFGFHPNDYETNNFDTLVDHELDPDEGSANPWREPVTAGMGRRYTAQLVFTPEPAEKEPNTVYVGETASGGFNPAVFVIYRIYAADRGALPPNSAGAKLPAVTVLDENGEVARHFDECDPYPAGAEPAEDRTRFPAFPVPDHRAVFDPGGLSTASNWGLPVTLLANRDVLYVVASYSRAAGEVFVVRARKPRTPDRKRGLPLWSKDVDLRLWTVCTYNFWHGTALACLVDEEVPAGRDGSYTLVASDAAHRPRNATLEHDVAWLDTGPFLDGQLTWRMLLREHELLRRLDRAIDTGETTPALEPYLPRTAFCSRASFEAGGWRACFADASPESG